MSNISNRVEVGAPHRKEGLKPYRAYVRARKACPGASLEPGRGWSASAATSASATLRRSTHAHASGLVARALATNSACDRESFDAKPVSLPITIHLAGIPTLAPCASISWPLSAVSVRLRSIPVCAPPHLSSGFSRLRPPAHWTATSTVSCLGVTSELTLGWHAPRSQAWRGSPSSLRFRPEDRGIANRPALRQCRKEPA
jgi:hypothetical protein